MIVTLMFVGDLCPCSERCGFRSHSRQSDYIIGPLSKVCNPIASVSFLTLLSDPQLYLQKTSFCHHHFPV